MAQAGLLFDMTDYVDGLGWKGIFPEWYFDEHKVDGRQYGMSNSETLLGLFYNKQVFADNELEVPKTYEDLLSACETLKGEMTPISIAMKDQWETFHYATMYYTAFAGADVLVEAEMNQKGFDSPEFVAGLQAFVDLVNNGYTSNNPNGVSYDDSLNEFQAGESAMVMTGTWMATDLYDTMGENVGFFSFPPADGIEPGLSGGTGDEFLINADTEYPQIALELVDAIVSDPNTWVYAYLPVSKVDDPASLGLSPVQQEIYNEIMNASGIAAILDLYMPSYFNEEIQNLGQELVAGIKTPEEMSGELQSILDNEGE
jgi:raffinose/stachyose/melibiose transport system substrate-binding protein